MAENSDLDQWLRVAIQLAKEAGTVVRNAIGAKKNIETKCSYADLVTESDRKVEELLKDGFSKNFPSHKFIGEESTSMGLKCELTDSPTWIIDPIDGTMNFVHGFPYVAVSIGLAVNKNIVVGVVYNPVLDHLYYASKGKGSFCNDKRLTVSSTTELPNALVAMELGSNRSSDVLEQVFANYKNLSSKVHGLRSMGSAALNMCAVASGSADAYYEYTIHCWDIAAGKIIVEEAGGTVIDPEGGPLDLLSRRVLCASTSQLATTLSSELKHIAVERD